MTANQAVLEGQSDTFGSCYSAKKHLPNGQNAHCTVRSPDGWDRVALGVAMRHTKMSCPLDSLTKTGPPRKLWGLYGK
jgi:hypothetical protein